MRLVLIRHGQSTANAAGIIQGQLDFPLSESGIQQAKELGEWLKHSEIDILYASDLSRAYQTAEAVNVFHSLQIEKREELREVNLGRFQGKNGAQIKEEYPKYAGTDLFTCGLDDVEQIDQLQERALSVLEELLAKHYGEKVYVVSHGGFINALLQGLLGIKWSGKRKFVIENTSMTTIDFSDPKHYFVAGVNETPHLGQAASASMPHVI